MKTNWSVIVLLLVALVSCKRINELKTLGQDVTERTGIKDVKVGINDGRLIVTFIDPPFIDSPKEYKEKIAKAVGELAKQDVKSFTLIDGKVRFVREAGKIFRVNSPDDYDMAMGTTKNE